MLGTEHSALSDFLNSFQACVFVQCLRQPYQYLCLDLGSFIFYKHYFSLVSMDMFYVNNLQCLKIRLKNCSFLDL